MICPALTTIGIPEHALVHGASMDELNNRSGMALFDLDLQRRGKEFSIRHMMEGGNGFPPVSGYGPQAAVAVDCGITLERRDMRSYLVWFANLDQCLADRQTKSAHR